ncbi:hypothetical protein Fot_39228 [Forsythia ovata]|uniref:Uncharacterized protein n=1 Tax=Forsythia ovata TaxID=205694 RepID=A0ABD1S403_9LAMI
MKSMLEYQIQWGEEDKVKTAVERVLAVDGTGADGGLVERVLAVDGTGVDGGLPYLHGRPPKPQPEPFQNDVPVFVHGVQNFIATAPVSPPNMAVGPGAVYVSIGSVNGDAPAVGVGVKSGRERPAAEKMIDIQ